MSLALTPLYGQALRGIRAVGSVPQNQGQNITVLGALGTQGSQSLVTPDGATDGAVFRIFVHQVLCPVLAHGDIVVMDNVRAHKVEGSGKQLKAVGVSSSTYRRIRPISR